MPDPGPSSPQPSPPVAVAGPDPSLHRVLRGPNGLGTAGLRLGLPEEAPGPPEPTSPETLRTPPGPAEPVSAAEEGRPIPGLYHHPVAQPDPARVEEVSHRIKAWAVEEAQVYPPEWEEQFDGFSVGRYMVACHPDAPTVDHLMVATRLMVAENVLDDCYCEDHGGSPIGLGSRLLLAHTALDPLHTSKEYEPPWVESLQSDAPRRAYRSAMEYFLRSASASQADRYRHDMAGCTWATSRRPRGRRRSTYPRCGSTWRCASSTTSAPAPPSPTPSAAMNSPPICTPSPPCNGSSRWPATPPPS
ncbi:hypothetical protein SALBM135S_01416 [Streptomyces alboniger]